MNERQLTLRPPTLDDVPQLAAFYGEVQRAHGTGGASESEIRDRLANPFLDAEEDFRIAFDGTEMVGAASIWDQNRAHERFFLDLRAHPRDRAAYAAFLDWGERRARSLAGDSPAAFKTGSASDDELLAAELRKRGFRLVRHFLTMEIDLAEDVPAPEWPEGVAVRTFRADDVRPVYDADMEAFADHWDFAPVDFEEWRQYHLESSEFDPTLWFVAEDGGEIAGFALCRSERRPNTGHVGVLGVRRPWRNRGLGRALLLHSFAEFRRRGRARADLGVDAENLTGAVRLYERAGMHTAQRFDAYEKPLGSAGTLGA